MHEKCNQKICCLKILIFPLHFHGKLILAIRLGGIFPFYHFFNFRKAEETKTSVQNVLTHQIFYIFNTVVKEAMQRAHPTKADAINLFYCYHY